MVFFTDDFEPAFRRRAVTFHHFVLQTVGAEYRFILTYTLPFVNEGNQVIGFVNIDHHRIAIKRVRIDWNFKSHGRGGGQDKGLGDQGVAFGELHLPDGSALFVFFFADYPKIGNFLFWFCRISYARVIHRTGSGVERLSVSIKSEEQGAQNCNRKYLHSLRSSLILSGNALFYSGDKCTKIEEGRRLSALL